MAGRPPPSFKTDVNRQKTKKWTVAKSYSYEGDDWGGYDEFGEYGTYDEPQPSNTGFRQPGQTLPPVNTDVYSASPASAPSHHPRINSFETGDDRRNISAGAGPPSGMGAAAPGSAQRVQSPRTVSQPLTNIPYEHSTPAHPPRQSSLSTTSQEEPPLASSTIQQEPAPPQDFAPTAQPSYTEPGPSDADTAAARTTSPKPFPFIRPADIYKRIEEERERERRSMDSNRTSLESVERARKEERSSLASPSPRLRESSGSPGGMRSSLQPVPERKSEYGMEGVSIPDDAPQQAAPALQPEPVPAPVHQPDPKPEPAPAPAPFSVPKQPATHPTPPSAPQPPPAFVSSSVPAPDANLERGSIDQPSTQHPSSATGFSLPQLNRFSGFGSDFWDPSSSSSYSWEDPATSPAASNPSSTKAAATTAAVAAAANTQSAAKVQDPSLQHQPSLGFRSAVEHAFDANDQNPSPGPNSGQGSQRSAAGSDFSAGASSTAGISPIMSRVPSGSTAARKAQDRSDLIGSSIIEEGQENTSPQERPDSSITLKGPAVGGDTHTRDISAESAFATTTTSGYRRDMNPPNMSSNAARSLTLQTEPPVPEGSSAEFGRVSPSSNYTETPASAADAAQYGSQSGAYYSSEPASIPNEDSSAGKWFQSSADPNSAAASGRSSPARNRVKNLASQYDEMHNSRSNSIHSNQSDRSRPFSPDTQTAGGSYSNPTGDLSGSVHDGAADERYDPQMEAAGPRPQLPGSWVSFADSSASTPAKETGTPTRDQTQAEEPPNLAPDTSNTEAMGNQPSNTAMAAVTAAGSALAASVASAVGSNNESTSVQDVSENRGIGQTQPQPLSPHLNVSSTGSTPTGTPLSKHSPVAETTGQSGSNEYFNSPAPLRQANPSPINTSFQPMQESHNARTSSENSDGELDSERLHEDIVRSLNQTGDDQGPALSPQSSSRSPALAPPSPRSDDLRQSTAIPREYDSYWATGQFERTQSTIDNDPDYDSTPSAVPTVEVSSEDATTEPRQLESVPEEPKSRLTKRFSWEEDDEEFTAGPSPPFNEGTQESYVESVSPVGGTQTSDRSIPASPVEPYEPSPLVQPTDGSRGFGGQASSYAIPEITFGDPAEDEDRVKDFTLSDPSAGKKEDLDELEPQPEPELEPAHGTQPPRDSVESQEYEDAPTSAAPALNTIKPSKLAAFRDIMAMKQPTARIETFNKTRDDFASMETGLGQWLSYMVATYPEHAYPSSAPSKPTVNTGLASSVKTKLSPSMAKAMSPSGGSQPYYQQYLNSPGALPPASSAAPGQSSSSPTQADSSSKNRTSGGQMQNKGKDFLHSAGVLGGKASTGAKGLFAKGKNRLKQGSSDKGQTSSKSAPSRGIFANKTFRPSSQTPNAPVHSAAETPTEHVRKDEPPPATPPKLTLPFEHPESSSVAVKTVDTQSAAPSSTAQPQIIQQPNQFQLRQSSPQPNRNVRGLEIYHEDTTAPAGSGNRQNSKDLGLSGEPASSSLANQAIVARDFSMSGAPTDIHPSGGHDAPARSSEDYKSSFESFRTAHDDLSFGKDVPIKPATPMASSHRGSHDSSPFGSSPPAAFQQSLPPQHLDVADDILDPSREKSIRRRLKQSDEARRSLEFLEADAPRLELGSNLDLIGDSDAVAPRGTIDQEEILFDRNPNTEEHIARSQDRYKKTLSAESLEMAAARLKEKDYDVGSPSTKSSMDSKDMRFNAKDIHPAMRQEFYNDTNIQRSRGESASSSSRPPAVEPEGLPPSVRKQYEDSPLAHTSLHNLSRDSQAVSSNADQSNSQNLLAKPPTLGDDTASRDASVDSKKRGMSPWQRFRARSRGNSMNERDAVDRPATAEGSQMRHEEQESSRRRSKSPWRLLRPRSRGKSLGEADALAEPAPVEPRPRGRSRILNATKRLSMPPLPIFRPRSRGASVGRDSEQQDESARPWNEETSAWQRYRTRSKNDGLGIDQPETGANDQEKEEISAWQKFRTRSRGGSVDTDQEQGSRPSTEHKQDTSVWQRLRARSRGDSIEAEREQENPTAESQQEEASSEEHPSEYPSRSPPKQRNRGASMDVERHAPQLSSPLKQSSTVEEPEPAETQNISSRRHPQQPRSRVMSMPPTSYSQAFSSMPPPRFPRPLNAGRPRNLPSLQTNVGPARPVMPPAPPGVHTPPLSHYTTSQNASRALNPERRPPGMRQRPERTSDMVYVPVAPKEEAPPPAAKSTEKKRRSWFGGFLGGSSSSSSPPAPTKQTRKLSKADPRPAELKPAEVSGASDGRGRANPTPLELETEEQSMIIRIPIHPPAVSNEPDPDPLSRPQPDPEPSQTSQERATGLRNRASHKQYLQSHGVLPAHPVHGQFPANPPPEQAQFQKGRRRASQYDKPLPSGPTGQIPIHPNLPNVLSSQPPHAAPSDQPRTLRRTSASARTAAMASASRSAPRPTVPSISQREPRINPVPPPPQFYYEADAGSTEPINLPALGTSHRWDSHVTPPPLPSYLTSQTSHEPLAFAWEEDTSGANAGARV